MFSNREIATALWLVPVSVWLLSKPSVRASCKQLLNTFLNRMILTSLALMLLYTVLLVSALHALNIWHVGLLKDTILWFCFSAISMMTTFVARPVEGNIFKSILKDNVKVVLLLEFIVNAYNFTLLGELVFVPIITFVLMLNAVSQFSEEHRPVTKLTNGILAITGFLLLYLAISSAIGSYQQFGSTDTLRALALPPLLSVFYSPFVFAAVLYSTYERVFVHLRPGRNKPMDVMRYARRKIIRRFGLRLSKLNAFHSANPLKLMQIQTRDDIDSLFASSP